MADKGVNGEIQRMLTNQEEKEKPNGNMSWRLEQGFQSKYVKMCRKMQI